MSKEISKEEKYYRQMLLLTANDGFMKDVFALRKKIKNIPPIFIKTDDGEDLVLFYYELPEFNQDIERLKSKHNLNSMPNFMLELFVSHEDIWPIHKYEKTRKVELSFFPDDSEIDPEREFEIKRRIGIELFPETTLTDIIKNWKEISKKRDLFYSTNNQKINNALKSENIERDQYIFKLKNDGVKSVEIKNIINSDDRFTNKKITYSEVSRIIKRFKDRAKTIMPSKEA